jgi:hypothetical protein
MVSPLRRVPQVLVDEVAVEVHRHRRRGVPQDPLHDLGVGAGTEPDAGGRVSQVVDAQVRYADLLDRLGPADRPR